MTTVSNDRSAALQARKLPLEVLVKSAATKERATQLRKLELPRDLNMSKAVGPKGSYRSQHVLEFLEKWLEVWTPSRAERNDWRILYMDAYRAHMASDIADLCHSRGYILLFHYGCTTGIAQVSDTDLHEAFSRAYIDMESVSFLEKQILDPSDISRTLQEVVDDGAAVWRSLDHEQAVLGHKRVGLDIALDGSEDGRLAREAALFWNDPALPMGPLRDEIVRDITQRVASGDLRWEDWPSLIQHPPADIGQGIVEREGEEIEGVLSDGEAVWAEDDAPTHTAEEELRGALCDEVSAGHAAADQGLVVQALLDDDPAEVEEALDVARELTLLEAMAGHASRLNMRAVEWQAASRRRPVEKQLHADTLPSGRANKVLRRAAKAQQGEARRRLALGRAAAAARRAARRLAKMKRAEANRLKKARAAENKVLKEQAEAKLAKEAADARLLGSRWGADAVGQGAKNPHRACFMEAREECMELLLVRCGPLPVEVAALWPAVRRFVALGAVGAAFIRKLEEVLDQSGKDKTYFQRWVRAQAAKVSSKIPLPATVLEFKPVPSSAGVAPAAEAPAAKAPAAKAPAAAAAAGVAGKAAAAKAGATKAASAAAAGVAGKAATAKAGAAKAGAAKAGAAKAGAAKDGAAKPG